MISYKTISNFRERLQALTTYKRSVYAGAHDEVVSAFHNLTIEQVRQNRDMILMQEIPLQSSYVYPIVDSDFQRPMVID